MRLGAGTQDIQGTSAAEERGFARCTGGSDAFIAHEEARVALHQTGFCRLIEAACGRARRILDVGCSTGGGAVAMALSRALGPEEVIGVDPDPLSLRAAEVRASAHELPRKRVRFIRVRPDVPLPFGADQFDLVVCLSVLEFVPMAGARRRLVDEMKRVVRPGGCLFLSTPSPLRVRDLHARRWLGDLLRRDGFPWAPSPWWLRDAVADFERVRIESWLLEQELERAGFPSVAIPRIVARAIDWARPWQNIVVRKPSRDRAQLAHGDGRIMA
ncbi:MAG: class I SAM-dependent methyltransferase [Polyangiaceae bacterium]|nr:class I SAM-dependent methyltransferase [Polyangiaceae bacterium]